MKTKKGIQTHNNIVNAAANLFATKAVDKTSVAEICKEAGIAKGTFYIYFETKDDLVWHFVDHQFEELYQWLATIPSLDHNKKVITLLMNFLVNYIQKNDQLLNTVHDEKFFNYFGLKEIQKRVEQHIIDPFALWLEKGIEQGKIQSLDPVFTSRLLVKGIHEMIDEVLYHQSYYTIEELCRLTSETLIKLLLT